MARIWLASLLVLTVSVAPAQQASGRITGLITDATGAAVPSVTVIATNAQTRERRQVSSNASGIYVLYPLPVGDYTLEAQKEGFKAAVQAGIRIDVNSSPVIDLRLEVGKVAERVNVVAEAPVIDTESQAIGNSRYEVQLKNLPIILREVQALVGQTAGVPYGTTDTVGGKWSRGPS